MFNKIFKKKNTLIETKFNYCDHEFVILEEYYKSANAGALIDVWIERKLQCRKCKQWVRDNNISGWKFKTITDIKAKILNVKNNETILVNNKKYLVGFCLFDNDIILTCIE